MGYIALAWHLESREDLGFGGNRDREVTGRSDTK